MHTSGILNEIPVYICTANDVSSNANSLRCKKGRGGGDRGIQKMPKNLHLNTLYIWELLNL